MMTWLEIQANEIIKALALGNRTNQVLIAAGLLTHVVGLAQPTTIVDTCRLVDVRMVYDDFGVYVRRIYPFAAEILREKTLRLGDFGNFRCYNYLLSKNIII